MASPINSLPLGNDNGADTGITSVLKETAAPHLAEVVTLYDSNIRDVPATLRNIADSIEAGEYGHVGCAGLVILGDTMEVFGMGSDSPAPSVGLLLHSGFMRLSMALEEHGSLSR